MKYYHYFEDPRRFLLVSELCDKGELFKYIQENDGKIEIDQTALILKQVTSAVLFMHCKRFVHRDLKPENILIDSISKDYIQIKLIDFGTALDLDKKYEGREKGEAEKIGTLNYMAPEVLLQRKKKIIDYK